MSARVFVLPHTVRVRHPTAPDNLEAVGECDWGGCDRPAFVWRWSGAEWLPVCVRCADKPNNPEEMIPCLASM